MKVVIVLNNLRVANGVATTIMNQYDALIENNVQVDFIQFMHFDSPYINQIKQNGGKIYLVSKRISGMNQIEQILKKGQYDIVHINQVNFQTVWIAIIAHHCGVKKVIFHSHNTKIPSGVKRRILERACNIVYGLFADELIACSKQAGEDSFGKRKFIVLKNSIDISKFHFDEHSRQSIRSILGINDKTFVVGTVCRYARQKNPLFMIDIMAELFKIRPNSKFLWIGSAPKEDDPLIRQIRDRIKQYNIEDNILLVGSKNDVEKWYSAMDAFMMPSIWEGLGITYIEAQANSLPTYASSVVPIETNITPLISYISLSDPAKIWAKAISVNPIRSKSVVVNYDECFTQSGYNLQFAKYDLLNIYKNA